MTVRKLLLCLFSILVIAPSAFASVSSGDIVSADPDSFTGGESKTVTVRVHVTGGSGNVIIECYSTGWTVSPITRNPTLSNGEYYNVSFTVTPPSGGGSGTIIWKLYDDGWGVHPKGSTLLDTYYQYVSASSSPKLYRTPSSLNFGSSTSSKSFTVRNSGGGTLTYSVSDNKSWISVLPTSGSSSGEDGSISVTVNRSGLSPGTYSGIVTINPSGTGSNQTVSISMSVPDGEPTASRYSPFSSARTLNYNASQTFIADGYDPGDDLAYAIWTLSGPESDSDTDSFFDTTSQQSTYSHTFDVAGDYTLRCRFFDDDGDYADATWSIHVNDPPKPDLEVTSMEIDDSTASDQHFLPGESVRLDFRGHNDGGATSLSSIRVKWWYGSSSYSKTNEIDYGYLGTVNGLSPDEYEWETDASWSVPTTPGTYWLTVMIDDNNQQTNEEFESNNERTLRFIVDPPPNRDPNTPSNLRVDSGSIDEDSARVLWNDEGDPDSDTVHFRVEYGKGTGWPDGWTVAETETTTESVTLTNLSPDTPYDVRVQAFDNNGGESGWLRLNDLFRTNPVPPVISKVDPTTASIDLQQGDSKDFEVWVTDADGGADHIKWYVDDVFNRQTSDWLGGEGNDTETFTFNNLGTHTIKAVLYDVDGLTDSVSWSIQVNEPAIIAVSTSNIGVSCNSGVIQTINSAFEVWNSGTNILNYEISESALWLTGLTPTNGDSSGISDKDSISFTVDMTGYGAGIHETDITITGGANSHISPQTVHIVVVHGTGELLSNNPSDVTDKNYLPDLDPDRFDDVDGDGTKEIGYTTNSSRCFAPGDTIVTHANVVNGQLIGTVQARIKAYYNTVVSLNNLTDTGMSSSRTITPGTSERFAVEWTAPSLGQYYVYVVVELESNGLWYQSDAGWIDGGSAQDFVEVTLAKPVILVHGWNGKADSFKNLELMIEKIFHRPVRSFEYATGMWDWPSDPTEYPRIDISVAGQKTIVEQLRQFVNEPELGATPFSSFDAITHSMGGLVARKYAVEPESKLHRLVTLGTPNYGGNLADIGAFALNNQAHDLEYGNPLIWDIHNQWATLTPNIPETLTIVGTDDEIPGNYNDSDGIVRCSSASLENFGYPIYYVPESHCSGPIGGISQGMAAIDDLTQPSWVAIKHFLDEDEYPFMNGNNPEPGNGEGYDDVGANSHGNALKSGAVYIVAQNGTPEDLIPVDQFDVVWNKFPLDLHYDGTNNDTGIYFQFGRRADSDDIAGTENYTDYEIHVTPSGFPTLSDSFRLKAGQTSVSVIEFNAIPDTPTPISPPDEAVLTSLTPTLQWSAFNSNTPGRTQAGFEVRVRCDTDGDVIVYSNYIASISGTAHAIPSGILEYGKHYHWHVRYKDNTGVWSDWSADDPNPHQDFYTVQPGTFTIYSDHGSPNPAPGSYPWTPGQTMQGGGTVSSPVDELNGSRWRSAGYTGTGDAPSGTGTSYNAFSINQDSTLTWDWIPQYQVNVSAGANGIISSGLSGWYDEGSNLTFTAQPNTNFGVNKWYVNGSSMQTGGQSFTVNNLSYPITVEVTFKSTINETYNWSIGNWGSCSVECGDGIQTRTVVCLDSSQNIVDDSLCNSPKPDTEQVCNLGTCPSRYSLSVSTDGSGSVSSSPSGIDCGSDCSESYDSDQVVTLTASPAEGSTFVGWSGGGCSGTGECQVTMDAAKTVTATFSLPSKSGWRYRRADVAGSGYYPYPSVNLAGNTLQKKYTIEDTTGTVLTGDVTGDEALELINVSGNKLRIYNDVGTLLKSVTLGSSSCSVTMIEDINGDGILDIGIGTGGTSDLKTYFYDGEGNLLKTISRSGGYDSSMRPAGLLRDGNFIVSLNAGYSHSDKNRGFAVYDKDTDLEKWNFKVGPAFGITSIADFDGDGNLDFANEAHTVHNGCNADGYNNNGTMTTDGDIWLIVVDEQGNEKLSKKYSSPSNGNSKHYFADLDHDGIMEILGFEGHDPTYYQGTSEVHLFDQSGVITNTFAGSENAGWSFTIADIDGDGKDEVIASNYPSGQTLYVLDHNLAMQNSAEIAGRIQLSSDLNGDGYIEVVLLDDDGNLKVVDKNLQVLSIINAGSRGTVIASDMDQDGIVELVCMTRDHGIHVFGNSKQAGQIKGDINADGKVELADAILALKVLAGDNQINILYGVDVNNDAKIGIEEAIYTLQIISGLRPNPVPEPPSGGGSSASGD